MAKTKISEFSANPANNTDIDSINIAEGCAPSGINDAIRELMAQLKDFQTGAVGDSFNGPIGTTTAAAGAFTTLAASGTVSGTGFSNYLASPPAIGGTTAAAVSATTLTTSSTVTHNAGTANGVTYLNGSKVLTSGSALTFDGTLLSNTQTTASGGLVANLSNTTTGSLLQFSAPGVANVRIGNPNADALAFYTFGLGSYPEQMRLTSTGLGIGTSSPSAKLQVADGNILLSNAYSLSARNAANTTSIGLILRNTSDQVVIDADGYGTLIGSGGVLGVFGSGNVGIGTSSPTARLTVVGVAGNGNGLMSVDGSDFIRVFGDATFGPAINWSTGDSLRFATSDSSFGSFTERARIDSSGNLLVGTTSVLTSGKVSVQFNGTNNNGIVFNDTVPAANVNFALFQIAGTTIGSIVRVGSTSAVMYNTTSDYRLKTVIGPVANAGQRIDALQPVEYEWNASGERTRGFLAHQFQEVYAGSVSGTKDAVDAEGKPVYQSMQASSSEVIADLVAEIQSLRQRLAALEAA